MRKKDLLELSYGLNNELEAYKKDIEEKNIKIENLLKEISDLKNEIENLKSKANQSQSLNNLENKVTAKSDLSDELKYGAFAIGKIVISATRHCNFLTEENIANVKELVNLILGRTEVAKAEILKIVSMNDDFNTKKTLIDKEISSSEDYFISVRGQI